MQAFQWGSTFVTGLSVIDEQHHHLTDLINRFGEAVTRPGGVSHAELESLFDDLANYTRYHFANEEAMMQSKNLAAPYIAHHKQVHAAFMHELTSLHRNASHSGNKKSDTSKSLLAFLTHWIAFHILGEDQCMARQVRAIESGVSPYEAYLNSSNDKHHDPATNALLTALNGLFSVVSQRNQELLELNATLEARVTERTQALLEANQRLRVLANTDLLTNLPNRRRALHILSREWTQSVQEKTPLSCMMLDADGFKIINDTYGHDAGDAVLRSLAQCLQYAVRQRDVACRLGGDEFLIICPQTTFPDALKLAQKVLESVNALVVPAGDGAWHGRTSIGVSTRTEDMHSMDDLIKQADEGLYAAKQRGKNQVVG